jgi:putative membrane protein
MITALKFIHLATIALWSGGLLALPFLMWQRRLLAAGPELDRLHRITRLVYVELASPAAFIAIASGTGLIFLQATFTEWFTIKMALVGLMAMLHVVAGLVIHKLFLPDGRFGLAALISLSGAYMVLITAIIWVVLAKPHVDSNQFATQLFEPGGLGRLWDQSFGDTKMPMP